MTTLGFILAIFINDGDRVAAVQYGPFMDKDACENAKVIVAKDLVDGISARGVCLNPQTGTDQGQFSGWWPRHNTGLDRRAPLCYTIRVAR